MQEREQGHQQRLMEQVNSQRMPTKPQKPRVARRLRQGGIPLYVGLVMLLGGLISLVPLGTLDLVVRAVFQGTTVTEIGLAFHQDSRKTPYKRVATKSASRLKSRLSALLGRREPTKLKQASGRPGST